MRLSWATYRNCTEHVTILSHTQELYWTCDYPEPHTGIVLNMWLSWATNRNCTEHVTILSHKQELYWTCDYPEPHTRITLNMWLSWATYKNYIEHVTILSHKQELYWIRKLATSSTTSNILGRFVTWLSNVSYVISRDRMTRMEFQQCGKVSRSKGYWTPKNSEIKQLDRKKLQISKSYISENVWSISIVLNAVNNQTTGCGRQQFT
jgi:hypothetical protein